LEIRRLDLKLTLYPSISNLQPPISNFQEKEGENATKRRGA
jgi:hypothetical protein